MGLLIAELVVGALIVITVAAVILAGMADEREASAKLDWLATMFGKLQDENIVMKEALQVITHLGESGNQTQAPSAAIAQQALPRVEKAPIRADRYDVTPQPGRRFA